MALTHLVVCCWLITLLKQKDAPIICVKWSEVTHLVAIPSCDKLLCILSYRFACCSLIGLQKVAGIAPVIGVKWGEVTHLVTLPSCGKRLYI